MYTNENCIGCNKCISACSCVGACVAVTDENGNNRIEVSGDKCVACGACLDVCEHGVSGPLSTDEIEYGLGSIYPMPGGLKENVYWFLGEDAFIRQIEGEKHMYHYLERENELEREQKAQGNAGSAEESQRKIENSLNSISEEAKELLETVSKISGRIEQLAAVTEEISASTDQILSSTEHVKDELNHLTE